MRVLCIKDTYFLSVAAYADTERSGKMDKKAQRFVVRGLAVLIVALLGYAFIRFGLPAVLPFITAFVISAVVRPISRLLERKTKTSEKFWSVVLIIAILGALSVSLWFLFVTLGRELKDAMKAVADLLSDPESPLNRSSRRMMDILSSFDTFTKELSFDIGAVISSALSSVTGAVASFVGAIVSGTPNFVFFVVVTVISLFYFTNDSKRVKGEIYRILPQKAADGLFRALTLGLRALFRFLKAYLSLFGINFAALSLGLFLVGVKYPILAALLCALVDILPVFGVGTVLVPWAVILFVTGETGKGVGMLILFGLLYILRQILEPKLVGGAAGVHPVLALLAVYLGFRLGGVGGMICAPILLNGLSVFWEEKRKKDFSEVDKGEERSYNYKE